MANVKPRRYNSARRQENAEETRRRIVEAARELFMTLGYGGARITTIAKKAGVASQTVYAAFGNKRGILFAMLDEMAVGADRVELRARLAEAGERPSDELKAVNAFNVRFHAGNADLINLVRTVSGVEPDFVALWEEGEGRRYRAETELTTKWHKAGALKPGLSRKEATDIWWALSGADGYRLFVIDRGWTQERFVQWLDETLETLLLAPER